MLWIDKHRPQTLDALTFHAGGEVVGALLLRRMACRRDLPHLLVHGPPGAGRKTRVAALLRAVYGAGAARTRVETKAVPLSSSSASSSAVVEVAVVSSNFHVEVCPADAGPTHDRAVVQSLVKDVAQTRPLLTSSSSSSSSDTAASASASSSSARAAVAYKVVVVHDADRLSRAAQDALRRTMERHARSCRVVLVAASACRVSAAIRSRCALVRVPAPSDAEVAAAVDAAARAEGVSAAELPPSLALRIAAEAAGNARKALLLLEAHCVRQRSAKQQQQQMPTIGATAAAAAADAIVLERAEWEEYVAGLAMDVAQEQTPRRLAEARMKVYELLTHCIPPEVVLRRLLAELLRKVDSQLQHDLVRWAAFYEHRMRQGTKPIYHIEAFLARFMGAYSAFLLQAFA